MNRLGNARRGRGTGSTKVQKQDPVGPLGLGGKLGVARDKAAMRGLLSKVGLAS